jgi:hypothetical protein
MAENSLFQWGDICFILGGLWLMNNKVKLILYAALIAGAMTFGYCFYVNYGRFMKEASEVDQPIKALGKTSYQDTSSGKFSRLLFFGGCFFVTVLGLGVMVGHDFSHLAGEKFGKLLFSDEGETIKKTAYESAEEIWANGDPLQAIQMMREYLQQNPREQHVALRIAEIYEKDLNNPLAAALELEEVLKQKLAPEQWGWTAIHLCNLYSSKLNQPAKAVALLRRIDQEYGETAAAEKARKRLETQDTPEGAAAAADAAPIETPPPPPPPPAKPGPITNSGLQTHFDKFHQGTAPEKNPPEET